MVRGKFGKGFQHWVRNWDENCRRTRMSELRSRREQERKSDRVRKRRYEMKRT